MSLLSRRDSLVETRALENLNLGSGWDAHRRALRGKTLVRVGDTKDGTPHGYDRFAKGRRNGKECVVDRGLLSRPSADAVARSGGAGKG